MKQQRLLSMLESVQIVLLLIFIFSSCNGQTKDEKQLTETETGRHAVVSDAPSDYRDPLFFIEGQLCQHLRKIFQDRKGNLWLGTNVYDLMLYNQDTLAYITEKEGFSGGRVTGIAEDTMGNLWFATGFGLNKYDGESFTVFTEKEGLLNSEIWSLLIDRKGLIWIGTNEGLCYYDGHHFTTVEIPKAPVKEVDAVYSPDRITGIAEDQEGNLWFGTDGYGICKYDGENFTNFTEENGLCNNTIYEIMADSRGNLWIGTFWGGVSKYDGEKFINFTKDGEISGEEVSGFFEDKNGDIWFAAENNGVYRYNGKSFTNFYQEAGLVTNGILSIYRDRENRFWFGGWGGLFRFDGQTFLSVSKNGPWEK